MSAALATAVEFALQPPVHHAVVIGVDGAVAGAATVDRCRAAAETIRAQGQTVALIVVRDPSPAVTP